MAWNLPDLPVAGTIATVANWGTKVRDSLRYLKGLDGVPTIESGLTIDNTDGDERLLLPLLSTAECTTVLNAEGEVAFDEQTHRVKIYDNDGVESLVSTADVDDTPANGATTDPVSSNWAYDHITDADQHPEYQKESLLTTAGDLPYATAASTWVRLPIGTALQYLRTNVGATAPEWAAPPSVIQVATKVVNYNDTSPVLVFTTPAAAIILSITLYINTAYNATSRTISVGDAGDADGIGAYSPGAATTGWYPSDITSGYGAYLLSGADFSHKGYTSATAINCAFTNAGATTGQWTIKIFYIDPT